mgnify:CR=1 FL=1
MAVYNSFPKNEESVLATDFKWNHHFLGDQRSLERPLPGLPVKVVPSMALAQLATSFRSEYSKMPKMRQTLSEVMQRGSEADCLERVQAATVQELNRTDESGSTPLHHAVRRRMVEVSQAILERSDFEALQEWDSQGETALHQAVKQADAASCCLILGKDATMALAENRRGQTAAEVAMRSGDRVVIAAFQECRARR